MFKKVCLTLCLTAFLAWADEFDDFDNDPGAVSVSAGTGKETNWVYDI